MKLDILIVEDNKESLRLLRGILKDDGHSVLSSENREEALVNVDQNHHELDVIILDLYIPDKHDEAPDEENGFAVLQYVKNNYPSINVVILTAFEDIKLSVRGIKAGAYDFLIKPLKLELLRDRLQKISISLANERKILDYKREYSFQHIIGTSRSIEKVLLEVEKIADSDLSVLICGETGTGKELIARAIHEESCRKGEFVSVNCGAIPENLLESEFFGHKKGSFTGAIEDRIGKFEQAHNGTMFLDEIGEMNSDLQIKLLRALEEKKITRIGENKEILLDVRIVSATNKRVDDLMQNGSFREDLFFRLKGMQINLPPLRKRADDIPLLAKHFLDEYCKEYTIERKELSVNTIEKLLLYKWPGNIRELRHLMQKTAVLNREKEIINEVDITFEDFSSATKHQDIDSLFSLPLSEAKNEFERRYLKYVLDTNKNQKEAANKAGVEKSNFSKLIKRYDLP